ncbi:MAG: DinB family protein [Ardenticatenaceae bacterium]|nr:DinB family protein [Ardenticatenaceae bacterium]
MSRRSILLEALAATPRDLSRMVPRIDGVEALWRPAPEAWCLAHFGFVEEPYLARLRRVLEQDNPYEPPIHPDKSAHDLTRPLSGLLEEFVARRAETIAFLSALSQRDWGRPLVHETIGPTRLRDQVQELVTHDNNHLAQIVALRETWERKT